MASKNDDASRARNKVYYAARAALIEAHPDEYRELLNRFAEEAGVTLSIRKTKEERAAEQIEKLLKENPELRDRFAAPGLSAVAEG